MADTPDPHGFSLPPEWHPHAATWTGWPFDDDLWEGYLEEVREEFAELVATIARFEPVVLNVASEEAAEDARRRLGARGALERVTLFPLPLDDIWFRDNGPLFLRDARGRVALSDWCFNGWGEKYPFARDDAAPARVAALLGARRFAVPYVMEGGALEVNGAGVCLTTRQCLLNQNRNPNLSQEEIEALLAEQLGVKHVVWLERGLEGDHTDGHIDTIVRFADDHTIVASVEADEDDPNHAAMAHNLQLLRALRSPEGEPYRIVELPLPDKRVVLDDAVLGERRLPLTYANFYLGNGFVVVPQYDDVRDAEALDALRPLFADREVIGLPASALITGGGAFHCVTQQQPEGEIARA